MTDKKITTLIALALLAVAVSGCSSGSRTASAHLRWERTMDKARVEAAQQSFDEGRLVYAERILKDCQQCSNPESRLSGQAQKILAKVHYENERYVQAGQTITRTEDMMY